MIDKNELANQVMNVEYVPDLELKTYQIEKAPSFSIQNLASMGSAVKPLVDLIGKVSSQGGGSGVYYVNTAGKKMHKSAGNYIGSLKASNGGVGGGQATMRPIALDPASIASACAVMAIEHKINEIRDGQKDIMDFMLFQEQSKIQGNINTLLDILNNYKYNADNEKYKNNKHVLVQSIKNESEKSILLVEALVNKMIKHKKGLHLDQNVDAFLKEAIDRLNDYQLGIYQYAFSSFLEIMLLENFNENYIDAVMKNITMHKEKYALACTNVNQKAQELYETSVQNALMLGASKVTSGMGKFIEKTPLGKTSLDEKLLAQGQKFIETKNKNVDDKVKVLSEVNSNLTENFEKTLERVKMIYNDEYSILFDNENIYLDFEKNSIS